MSDLNLGARINKLLTIIKDAQQQLSLLEHEVLRLQHSNPSSVLDERVDALELQVRAINILKSEGITYIGDLVQLSASQVRRIPGIGKSSQHEILEVLASRGLSLQGHPTEGWTRPTNET